MEFQYKIQITCSLHLTNIQANTFIKEAVYNKIVSIEKYF